MGPLKQQAGAYGVGVEYAYTMVHHAPQSAVKPQVVPKKPAIEVPVDMDEPVHIAITRRVRKNALGDFERALADFASRSLPEPGARGVHCLYPPPGSGSTEYGVMRTFAIPRTATPFTRQRFIKNGSPKSTLG